MDNTTHRKVARIQFESWTPNKRRWVAYDRQRVGIGSKVCGRAQVLEDCVRIVRGKGYEVEILDFETGLVTTLEEFMAGRR